MEMNGYTCIIRRDDEVIYTSKKSGIMPLIDIIDSRTDVADATADDKIVGRAAAMLYTIMGVKCVSAEVMSRGGLEILQKNGIDAEHEILTDRIINRRGDDICPMEKAVSGTDNPTEALNAIRQKIAQMAKPTE